MPKIYALCGLIGSGKTTYAKTLAKQEAAFRFSVDEWMIPLFGEHMSREELNSRIGTFAELFKEAAEQMIRLNVSVIFDFGFWYRDGRENLREWAADLGTDYELIYIDTPFDECASRALTRNSDDSSDSYHMNEEMLELFRSWFEVPDLSENPRIIRL